MIAEIRGYTYQLETTKLLQGRTITQKFYQEPNCRAISRTTGQPCRGLPRALKRSVTEDGAERCFAKECRRHRRRFQKP